MIAVLCLLGLLVILEAAQQGVLTWVLREFMPQDYHGVKLSRYTGYALHEVGVAAYLLVAAWLAHPLHLLGNVNFWLAVVVVRVCLFDPLLNLTRNTMNRLLGRPWEPLFAVGTSSLTDRLIRFAARPLRLNPSLVSGGVRLLAVATLVALLR